MRIEKHSFLSIIGLITFLLTIIYNPGTALADWKSSAGSAAGRLLSPLIPDWIGSLLGLIFGVVLLGGLILFVIGLISDRMSNK